MAAPAGAARRGLLVCALLRLTAGNRKHPPPPKSSDPDIINNSTCQPFHERVGEWTDSGWHDCAVVGGSPSLLKHEHGAEIDNRSVVIRVHNHGGGDPRYAKYVGTSTSVHIIAGSRTKLATVKERARETGVLFPTLSRKNFDSERERAAKGERPPRVAIMSDCLYRQALALVRMPSSGFQAVNFATRVCDGPVHLYGFGDTGGAKPEFYHFDDKPGSVADREARKSLAKSHDVPREHMLLRTWAENNSTRPRIVLHSRRRRRRRHRRRRTA